MKPEIKIPDITRKELELMAGEGVFLKRKIKFWRGNIKFSFGDNQKFSFQPSKVLMKHEYETNKLLFLTKRLFFFFTFGTKYGYFVPKANLKKFWEISEELKEKQRLLCEYILSNYKIIESDLNRRYAEIAHFKWLNVYKYPGEPPDSYIRDFCEKHIVSCSEEQIKSRFVFELIPLTPFITEQNEAYAYFGNLEKINSEVIDAVYLGIIKNRRVLVNTMLRCKDRMSRGLSTHKRIAKFCQFFEYSICYDDKDLFDKIHSLKMICMNSFARKDKDIYKGIDAVVDSVIKNERYLVGYVYSNKIQRYHRIRHNV